MDFFKIQLFAYVFSRIYLYKKLYTDQRRHEADTYSASSTVFSM